MEKEEAIKDIKRIMVEQKRNFGLNRPNPFLPNITIGDWIIHYRFELNNNSNTHLISYYIIVCKGMKIGVEKIEILQHEYLELFNFYKKLGMGKETITELENPSKEYLQNNMVTVIEIGTEKPELYIGCKIIKATPMNESQYTTLMRSQISRLQPAKGEPGYLVEYSDGFKSWLPKAVFENAYRKITESEFKLLNS